MSLLKKFFLIFSIGIVFIYFLFHLFQAEIGKSLVEFGVKEDCKDFSSKKIILNKSFQKVTHYLKKEGKGIPIVLLPGGSMEASMLCSISEVFQEENYPIFILENPAHGKNKVTSLKTLKKQVLNGKHWALSYSKHVQKTLDKLEIERFNLIGYSLGGGTGTFLIARNPEKVKKAIFIAPAGFEMVYTKRLLTIIKEGAFKETYAWETLEEFENLLKFLHMDPKMIPLFIKKGIVRIRLNNYGPGYWQTYFNSYQNLDITYPDRVLKGLIREKKLPPTLVIGMDKDQVIDINKLPEFSALLGAQFVKIIGSGHASHSKKEPLIKNFLMGLSPLMKSYLKDDGGKVPTVYRPSN